MIQENPLLFKVLDYKKKIWDTLGRSSTLSFFQSSSLSRWKDISHPADTREKRGCTPLYSLKNLFLFPNCVLGVVRKYGTCCTQCLVVGEYNRHKYMTGKEEEETPQFSDVTPLSTDDGNDVAAAVDPFSWPLFVAFAKCSASVSISNSTAASFFKFYGPVHVPIRVWAARNFGDGYSGEKNKRAVFIVSLRSINTRNGGRISLSLECNGSLWAMPNGRRPFPLGGKRKKKKVEFEKGKFRSTRQRNK